MYILMCCGALPINGVTLLPHAWYLLPRPVGVTTVIWIALIVAACCSVFAVCCNVWQIRVHSVSTSWFHVSFSTVAYNCESHYTTQVFHNCDVLQCFANVNRHTRLASIQSHLYIYECIFTCICTYIYVYIYICTYICVHVFVYMHSTSSAHQSYTSWHTYQWLVATIFTFHITSC